MQAAVCYEFGKPLVIEEIGIDPSHQDEIRAQIAASICHNGVRIIRGEWGS